MALSVREQNQRRAQRNRNRLRKVGGLRPRLSVFRSNKNISVQLIDDVKGVTIVSASTLESAMGLPKGSDREAAAAIGRLIAERAKEKGVTDVVFDRGGYLYHGRVKALADAAREAGLNF